MFTYKEIPEAGNPNRAAFAAGLDALVEKKKAEAAEAHAEYRRNIFTQQEKYRKEFRAMLGWPLTETFSDAPSVDMVLTAESNGVKIYRVTLTLLDCIPFYGLLFQTDDAEPKPLIIVNHDRLGTPEQVSSIINIPDGSSNNGNIVQRILKYGANVFVPQLFLWDQKTYRMGDMNPDEMRVAQSEKLKPFGISLMALELHGIERAIDWLTAQPWVKADGIGMIGLSRGGFYTLYAAAADTRIRTAISYCFFNGNPMFPLNDWSWNYHGSAFTDEEVMALIYPRPLGLQASITDCLIPLDDARASYRRFCDYAGEYGDYVTFTEFYGRHEFSWDDRPLMAMTKELSE